MEASTSAVVSTSKHKVQVLGRRDKSVGLFVLYLSCLSCTGFKGLRSRCVWGGGVKDFGLQVLGLRPFNTFVGWVFVRVLGIRACLGFRA